MDWTQIRRHYAIRLAAAKRQGLTQQGIARTGGLPGQNAISKLLSNHNLGPSVDTFVKAVAGLGLTVSQFFLEIESSERPAHAQHAAIPTPLDAVHVALITTRFELLDQRIVFTKLLARLEELERALGRVAPSVDAPGTPDPPRSWHRPAHRRRTSNVA